MNPMQMILNQMMNDPRIKQNPMASNAMDMLRKGDTQGLKSMAENLCKEQGTTADEMKQKIMQQFGMK